MRPHPQDEVGHGLRGSRVLEKQSGHRRSADMPGQLHPGTSHRRLSRKFSGRRAAAVLSARRGELLHGPTLLTVLSGEAPETQASPRALPPKSSTCPVADHPHLAEANGSPLAPVSPSPFSEHLPGTPACPGLAVSGARPGPLASPTCSSPADTMDGLPPVRGFTVPSRREERAWRGEH